MHFVRGKVTRQAHVGIPEGTVEEEFGRGGFAGRAAHLYRRHAPVEWDRIEGDLRPHAIAALEIAPPDRSGDYLASRKAILENDDVRVHIARFSAAMPYAFRNADADEILFVHAGNGRLETDFGPLYYRTGDYLVLPRGTMHRFTPSDVTTLFVVESRDEARLPDKGLLGKHALFDPAMIEVPTPAPRDDDAIEHCVVVQRRGALSRVFYRFDPFDTVGWKGDLFPYRINVADIRPVMSERYHLPPSAHATFISDSWVLCTFLPRGLETGDPEALKVPFYHSNIDFDEVIFYHAGDFFSREGIRPGMVTFHPQGIPHGPQPGAVEAAKDKTRTEEIAVMLDTVRPLDVTEDGKRASIPDYDKSWQRKEDR